MSIFFVLFVLTLFFPFGSVFADTYIPLCNKGWTIKYTDTNGDAAEKTYYGFKALHNPYDPIIVCRSETGCEIPPSTSLMSFGLNSQDSPSWSLPGKYFKIYIPPGSRYFSFIGKTQQSAQLGFVVRFRTPPTGDYSALGDYDQYNWVSCPSAPSDYEGQDILIQNSGGSLQVLGNTMFPEIQEGGWLYIQVLQFGRYDCSFFRKTIEVNVNTYLNWFDDPSNFDSEGNPGDGTMPGTLLEELDENDNGRVDMEDAIIKLQRNQSDPMVNRILQILTGQ